MLFILADQSFVAFAFGDVYAKNGQVGAVFQGNGGVIKSAGILTQHYAAIAVF